MPRHKFKLRYLWYRTQTALFPFFSLRLTLELGSRFHLNAKLVFHTSHTRKEWVYISFFDLLTQFPSNHWKRRSASSSLRRLFYSLHNDFFTCSNTCREKVYGEATTFWFVLLSPLFLSVPCLSYIKSESSNSFVNLNQRKNSYSMYNSCLFPVLSLLFLEDWEKGFGKKIFVRILTCPSKCFLS